MFPNLTTRHVTWVNCVVPQKKKEKTIQVRTDLQQAQEKTSLHILSIHQNKKKRK